MPSLPGFDIGLIRHLAGEKGKGGMRGLALCDGSCLLRRCQGRVCVSGYGIGSVVCGAMAWRGWFYFLLII